MEAPPEEGANGQVVKKKKKGKGKKGKKVSRENILLKEQPSPPGSDVLEFEKQEDINTIRKGGEKKKHKGMTETRFSENAEISLLPAAASTSEATSDKAFYENQKQSPDKEMDIVEDSAQLSTVITQSPREVGLDEYDQGRQETQGIDNIGSEPSAGKEIDTIQHMTQEDPVEFATASPRRRATLSGFEEVPPTENVQVTDEVSQDTASGPPASSSPTRKTANPEEAVVAEVVIESSGPIEKNMEANIELPKNEHEKERFDEEVTPHQRRNLEPDQMPDSQEGDDHEYMNRPEQGSKDEEKLDENANVENKDAAEESEERSGADINGELNTEAADPELVNEDIDRQAPLDVKTTDNQQELPWAMYKGMEKRERDEEDLPGLDSEDEIDQHESSSADVDDLMNQLDSRDGELESESTPPNIFGSDNQNEMHKYVDDLKLGLAEEEINEYLEQFEKRMEEEILMIGSISLEDVQVEERRLREEHITFQQQQAKLQRDRVQQIMLAMERAKKHVMQRFKEKYRLVRMREEHLMQRDRLIQDKIHRSFRRAENQLLRALKKRKGEVKTMYGDLIFADGQYGGSKGRRWKVDWNKTPQPIQIRLKCLRGVKDKLPGSRFVLMVSLYDRLGGHVMKWSNLKGQQWGGATLPLYHEGEFFNIEMKIDQSVFTVCPAKPDVRPGMVLVFELFILRGSVTATDKVVGWGCFPICDKEFNIVEGKYKSPLLRGDMDPNIDKFSTIEKLMASDLENWLCNLYFEIVKLPRYMAGQKEYEVELQFTSALASYPRRTKTGEEFVDGEKPMYGSHSDLASVRASRATLRSNHSASFFGSTYGFEDKTYEEDEKAGPSNTLTVSKVELPGKKLRASRTGSLSSSNAQLQKADALSCELRNRKTSKASCLDVDTRQQENFPRAFTVHGSRKVVEERGVFISDDNDSSGTDFSDDDVYNIKKDERYKPVKGQPGMYYKIHQNNPSDVYARKMYTMIPKTPRLTQHRKKKKLSHLEELQQHSFGVKPPWSNKGHLPKKEKERMQYIGRMLLAELGLSQWRSAEFWAMLLMITITWWIRMFLHYIGQLGLLYAILIPINKYQFLPYTVTLNYQNTLLRTREEIAVVVIGHFTNIAVMMLLVLFTWFWQTLFGRFPSVFSKFIMAFGLNTVFDPVWIAIVDSALLRFRRLGGDTPIGDAFKLYWHFNRYYTNANVLLFISISMTLFLYVATTFCAITILYMYFLRLHNKGRMMDTFWRLHGCEEDFFLPFDLEMSHEELSYICRKAEQWRGEEGERRKTAVYDYVWEEEEIPDEDWENTNTRGTKTGKKEITTHVSIHSVHLDGLRELYRHFLRSPEGAIVEVFEEMSLPGIDEAVKAALTKGTTYQGIDGLKRNRSFSDHSRSRASSRTSSIAKGQRRPSYFLDVPTFAPV